MKAVFSSSMGCILIWLYPEKASRKLNNLHPAALSTRAFMLGKGYESFGQALFKSVKSTHMRHFPLLFFTSTTFASHSGYWTSLMWPAARSFCVSSLIAYLLSSLNFLLLCRTGLTKLSIAK